MDQAQKGAKALEEKDFASAVAHYTDAISRNPQAVDYYIKRSTAYTRKSPSSPDLAHRDAEIAVTLAYKRSKRELIASAQLRRAVTFFGLEKWADSRQCLQWVEKYNPKENSVAMWKAKLDMKVKGLSEMELVTDVAEDPDVEVPSPSERPSSKDRPNQTQEATSTDNSASLTNSKPQPQGLQTPSDKIRHEWYQSNDSVIVTLFAKGIPHDGLHVEYSATSLTISFPLTTDSDYDFSLDPLFAHIDPSKSSHRVMSTKAEFTLQKANPGHKWSSLELPGQHSSKEGTADIPNSDRKPAPSNTDNESGPAYPTSSKSGPKNWDKLASDLTKRPKKAEESNDTVKEGDETYAEDEEGDPVNNFFKSLYQGADPDTRRAMMKSYQESNGTALSTNWAEVGKAKVETTPPDGMEAKKW